MYLYSEQTINRMKDFLQYFLIILIFTHYTSRAYSQNQVVRKYYLDSFVEVQNMLSGKDSIDFKKAVFSIEGAYYGEQIDELLLDDIITSYSSICNGIMRSENIEYIDIDKDSVISQYAVFLFMTKPMPVATQKNTIIHEPFKYNNDDFAGSEDWTSTFVSTLMHSQRGNCHSLPYLYKIIMDRLGYECHLALAPNHMYIKAYNKKVGWYNIELTCGDFPTDAWYAASGYIHTDAIRNGIYMRALSDKEAVAMTLVDLAQGYQAKYGIEDGSFIIKCCDTSLEHFPLNINAMLLKAEVLTELYKLESDTMKKDDVFSQMNELYANIHKLGYRKMPQQMYTNWLNSLNTEDRNQEVKAILNPRTN